MQVSIRLSAALAQITGAPRVQVEVAEDDATVASSATSTCTRGNPVIWARAALKRIETCIGVSLVVR